MIIKNLFLNILSMSTIAIIVFLLILVTRRLLKNKIEFSKYMLLWIIFIIVLIFPINFSSRLSIKNFIKDDAGMVLNLFEEEIDNNFEFWNIEKNLLNEANKKEFFEADYITMISYIWFSISVCLILKDLFLYKQFGKKEEFFDVSNRVHKILEICKNELNIKDDIKIVLQDRVKAPSLFGIFNVKILFTKEMMNLSNDELKHIILHELYHYKSYHHLIYLALGILEKIYWFNPVIYIAGRMIRQDIEIHTDEYVLNHGISLKDYCKTIIKVIGISSNSSCLMPSIYSEKLNIERRIKYMKSKKTFSKYSLMFLIVAITVIGLITVSLASDKIDSSKNEIEIKYTETLMDNVLREEEQEIVEFIAPLRNAKVTNTFGKRVHPITKEEKIHTGIDVVSDDNEIMAAADGTVIFADFNVNTGLTVKIEHANGSVSSYMHGSEIFVEVGDEVTVGEKIMLMGATGMATGPHLHFEIQNSDGEYLDVNDLF